MSATHEIRQLREIPGLMACVLTHKVESSTSQYKWTRPKLNEEWPAILAFFKWTYDTMKSESQVRLFVNHNTKKWKAWAFPQKARTNMNAYEIGPSDGEAYNLTKEQRSQFSDTDGWTYYGTVHHHCGCSAFQSGVDQQNEQSQDGIHITVGNMDKPVHDIHFRLYQNGLKLTSVKPMEFWDVGNISESIPEAMRNLLKPDWLDTLVAMQMGTQVPDATFPDIWKTNVMDVTPKAVVISSTPSGGVQYQSPHGYQGQNFNNMRRVFSARAYPSMEGDCRKARWECTGFLRSPHTKMIRMEDILTKIELLSMHLDDDDLNILDICCRNDVTPEALLDYVVETEKKEAELAAERAKQVAEGGPDIVTNPTSKRARKEMQAQQKQQLAQTHWYDQDFKGYPNPGVNGQGMADGMGCID